VPYFIIGVAALMRTDPTYGRWYRSPATAAHALLSRWGKPQGAGYYVGRGNDLRKLEPGRSD